MFTHIIVLPTYSCNCRCPYCYEDHASINMSAEVIESIKRFLDIQKQKGVSSLQLDFFGGEPTLQLNTVYNLSQYANKVFSDPDDEVIGGMTTNGVRLDFSTFKKLNEVGVRSFQITIDGPQNYHDKARVLVDGTGTYNVIMNNLETIRQSDLSFHIIIRIHVTPENISAIEQFSKNELSLFLSDPQHRFTVIYPPVVPLGGKHDKEFIMYANRNEAQNALEYLNGGKNSPKVQACFASRPDSIIILPDGKLSKCSVELNKSVVGQLFPDGTVQIDENLFNVWCRESPCPRDDIKVLNN